MNKIHSACLFFVTSASLLAGCQTRGFNRAAINTNESSNRVRSDDGAFSACMAIQGNGVKFPSHVGAFVALLEQDVVPEVVIGGSSGSIVGSVLRGLLENPSLKGSSVLRKGQPLSTAQKASLVLAASPDAMESFLFLPALHRKNEFLRSVLHLTYALGFGNSLGVGPESFVVSLEAVVGQAALLVDFFSHTDFRSVISLGTYEARARELRRLWLLHADAMVIDGKELVSALLTPNPNSDRQREISRRFFEMFREDPTYTSQQDSAEAWEEFNERLKSFLDGISQDPLGLGKRFQDAVRAADVPFFNKSAFASTKFIVASPEAVHRAWLGRKRFPSGGSDILDLPQGMVVHSTFRLADFEQKTGRWRERHGLENLFQGYIIPGSLKQSFVQRQEAATRDISNAFMPYQDTNGVKSFLPPENILIIAPRATNTPDANAKPNQQVERGLSFAIKASAGEPGPFRRDAWSLSLTDTASTRPFKETHVVSFGGWAEWNAMAEIMHLPECKGADFLVSSGKPGNGDAFQRAALRTALFPLDYMRALRLEKARAEDKQVAFEQERLDKVLSYARGLRGRLDEGVITNDLDFDAPSEHPDPAVRKRVNKAIVGNRMALMIAGYQRTLESLRARAPSVPRAHFSAWDEDLGNPEFNTLRSSDEELPKSIVKRLYPTAVSTVGKAIAPEESQTR